MHDLIVKYFGASPTALDEQRLAMALAWLEQAENEKSRLAEEQERLRLKNIELAAIVKNKAHTPDMLHDSVHNSDHFTLGRLSRLDGGLSQRKEEPAAFGVPRSAEDGGELLYALTWLEETKKESGALGLENRNLVKENMALLSVIEGKTPRLEELDDSVAADDHLSLRWPSVPSTPLISPLGDVTVRWRLGGLLQTIPIPKSLTELKPWVDQYLADRVELLPRAQQAAKKSIYENVTLVYQALLLLGSRRDMLVHGGLNERRYFEEKLHELGLRHGSSGGDACPASIRAQYKVNWNGASRELEQALKRDVTRDVRRILRIYFFYDEKTRKIIVGHLPTHLRNSLS